MNNPVSVRMRVLSWLRCCMLAGSILLLPVGAYAQSADDLANRMNAAAALVLGARDADGAIAAYLEIQKDYPEEIRPIYNLARLYAAQEDWAAAKDWFVRYRDHPQFPEDRRDAADAMIEDLEALRINDADPEKRKQRQYELVLEEARQRVDAGDREGAFTLAQSARDIAPERPEAYSLAAALLLENGDCDGAAPFLARGLEIAEGEDRDLLEQAQQACVRSDEYVARTTEARLAFTEDRFEEAAGLYEELARDFPEDAESAIAAATAHALASQYGKAADILKPLAKSENPQIASEASEKLAMLSPFLRPVTPETPAVKKKLPGAANYARGLNALDAGDAEEASLLFDEAIRQIHLSSDMADYFLGRGRARSKLGETEGAIADYRLASLLDPSRGETHVALASILIKADRIPQAVSELSTAIDLEERETAKAGLWLMRGRLYEKSGDHDSAFDDYRTAVAAGADAGGILNSYHARAVALAKEGQEAEALQTFERGLSIAPHKPLSRDYRALRQLTFAVLNRSSSGARSETYRSGEWDGEWIREKWETGYSVTDATWGPDKWTIVMAIDDAIGDQRIRFADSFPKDEIKAAWDDRFFIDRVVEFNGRWMLVASERDYSGQSWVRRETLDKTEVLSRIREKGEITDLTYSGGAWVMVNTRGSGLRDQKVETADSFPAAAIQKWIGRGYALTRLVHGNGVWWAVFSKGRNLGKSELFVANHLTGKGVESLKPKIQDGWKTGLRHLYFAQVTTVPK